MLGVEGVLGADSFPACRGDMEAEASIVVPGGANVPRVCGSPGPGAARLWRVENGGSRGGRGHWVAVEVVGALEGMVGGYFGMNAAFTQ